MICPNCGKDFKNLGVHERFCKKPDLIIDDYLGKSLSFTLQSIRDVLKSFRYKLSTTVLDENGEYDELEIKIRIPLRRQNGR